MTPPAASEAWMDASEVVNCARNVAWVLVGLPLSRAAPPARYRGVLDVKTAAALLIIVRPFSTVGGTTLPGVPIDRPPLAMSVLPTGPLSVPFSQVNWLETTK